MESVGSDEEYAYEREGLLEAESEFESEDEGARSDVSDTTVSRDTVIEAYNFEVSVAIAGRETVDEDDRMESEFSDAVEEIEGKKHFLALFATRCVNRKVA